MSRIDEIMNGVLVGMYTRAPINEQDDWDFVPLDDKHNVLRDDFKAQLLEYLIGRLPEKYEGKLSDDEQGWNDALNEVIEMLKGELW